MPSWRDRQAIRLVRGIGHYFPVTAAVASLDGVLLGYRAVTTLWGTGTWFLPQWRRT